MVATRGLEKIDGEIARGALIAFSTEPGHTAFDGAAGQHSPFTAALLRHIGDAGQPIETVMRKVREEVYEATASRQLPWVNTSIVGEFQLNPAAAPPPVKVASAEASAPGTENLLWQSAERSGAPEDYQTYLDAYPQGVFAPVARRRLATAHEASPEAAELALNLSPADRIAVQTGLSALKLSGGAADGVFGPGTRAAIAAWQKRNGLAATGFLAGDQMARLVAQTPRAPVVAAPAAKPARRRKGSRRRRSPSLSSRRPRKPPLRRRATCARSASSRRRLREKPRAAHRPRRRLADAEDSYGATTPEPVEAPAYEDAPPPVSNLGSVPLFSSGIGLHFGGGHHHGWSDRRLKRDIQQVGVSPSGLPIYTFRYLWSDATYRGVMAQDLLTLRPDAVHTQDGYYWVDYSALDVKFEQIAAR